MYYLTTDCELRIISIGCNLVLVYPIYRGNCYDDFFKTLLKILQVVNLKMVVQSWV